MRKEQTIGPKAERTAVSWTGGKDCNLALLTAWRNPTLNVTSLVVFRLPNAFKAHPIQLMEAQASALGLPLRHVIFPADVPSWKDAYVDGIRHLRDDHGIEVIVMGDMDLVGAIEGNWIEECCKAAGGVRAYLPLWMADRAGCLTKMVEEDFCIIYSCVKSPWFDESWIGRELNALAVEEMKRKSEMDGPILDGDSGIEYSPLDLGGEQGEYHTMCLDGPLYNYPVQVKFGEPLELKAQPSQKKGQRWWTIGDVELVQS